MGGRWGAAVLIVLACAGTADARTIAPAKTTPLWTSYGIGGVRGMAVTADRVLVAGSGAAAITQDTLDHGRPGWTYKTPDGPERDSGGDFEYTSDAASGDVDGDGAIDLLLGTSDGLRAIDGETGELLWVRSNPDWFAGVSQVEAADFDGDGRADVAFLPLGGQTITVADGATGEDLWTFTLPTPMSVFGLDVADVDGDGATDVLARGNVDFALFPDLQVVSGLGAAQTGTGTLLWSASTGGDPLSVAVGDIVAGGTPEVAVGQGLRTTGTGEPLPSPVRVFSGAGGVPLATTTPVVGGINDIELVQVEPDGGLEIVAALGHNDDNGESRGVLAYDALSPAPLWTYDAPQPVTSLLQAGGHLVAAGGYYEFRGRAEEDGFVAALDPASGAERWRRGVPTRVEQLEAGTVFGAAAVVAGEGIDGAVEAFAPAGGERLWRHATGGQVTTLAAGDVTGDGRPEVVSGTGSSEVVVHDRAGERLWTRRLPGQAGPDVTALATGRLGGAAGADVVVGTQEYAAGPDGRLHAYSETGATLWSAEQRGAIGDVAVADLDGSGPSVVALTEASTGGSGEAKVLRLDRTGSVVWERPAAPGFAGAMLEFADLGGDPALDLVTGSFPFGPAVVRGVDGATGATLWEHRSDRFGNWIDAARDGALTVLGDAEGRVTALRRDGTVRWRSPGLGANSRGGTLMGDVTGDGVPDVAHSVDDNTIRGLDGADGSPLWSAPFGFGEEELGGPVELVRTDGADVLVAGASANSNGRRQALDVLDPATGAKLGAVPTLDQVFDVHAADLDADGDEEALGGSGRQLHVLDPDGDRLAPRVQAGPAQQRAVNDFTLDLTADGPQETPVAAAHVRVCAAGGACGAAVRRAFFEGGALTGLQVPGEGRWVMEAWLEDAAGNADPALAVPVPKLFDATPPDLALERAEDDRTRAVRFTVADEVAGLDRVTIERRRGDEWVELPAEVAEGVASATLPADGRFPLRATAVDHVGNTRTVGPVEVAAGPDPQPGPEPEPTPAPDPEPQPTATPTPSATTAPPVTTHPPVVSPRVTPCTVARDVTRRSRLLRLRRRGTRLQVVARLRSGIVLERRDACGRWTTVRRVRPGRRYRVTTPGTYRLRSGRRASAPLTTAAPAAAPASPPPRGRAR